ncbi:MAG: hypothetical protein KAT77_04740 [Nanoarchaeota archaeon]|nr:hypothetical protein [Nanoarchaeota archaeon]
MVYYSLRRSYSPNSREQVEKALDEVLGSSFLGAMDKEVFISKDDDGPMITLDVVIKTNTKNFDLPRDTFKLSEYRQWANTFCQATSASLYFEMNENQKQVEETIRKIEKELGIKEEEKPPFYEIRVSVEPKKTLFQEVVSYLGLVGAYLFPPKYTIRVNISDKQIEKVFDAKEKLKGYPGKTRLEVARKS